MPTITNAPLFDEEVGDDILKFWNQHRQRYSTLTNIALGILATFASDAEVERLFSAAKFTMGDNRSSLRTDQFNNLIFVLKNLAILDELNSETNVSSANVKR